MEYSFGSGVLYGKKSGSNQTPVRFGAIQGTNIDIAFTTKQLFGGYQFPLAIGRGTAKVTGKSQFAQLNALAFNDLFFGESSVATGSTLTATGEQHNVTANIATVTNNTTYVEDLGVLKASDGTVYTRVASGPLAAQYSVNESTGVYTFNSSENGTLVNISYTYSDAVNGKTVTLTNQLLGSAPQFKIVLTEVFNSKKFNLQLNACMSEQLTMPLKLEDFMIMDFNFQAFADSSNTLGLISVDE
jgi:hypothetical protein